jgi:hypothetical protein
MSQLVISITETRAEVGIDLGEGQIIRQIKDNSWVKLRIAARMSVINDTGAIPLNRPLLAMGLCSGNTNSIADETCAHFFGYGCWYSTGLVATWGRSVGATYIQLTPGVTSMNFGIIENGVWRDSGVIAALTNLPRCYGPISGSGNWASSVLAFDITKLGGTNYDIRTTCHRTGTTDPDITRAVFEYALTGSTISIGGHAGYTPGTTTTTVDEATYGTLDHFNMYWSLPYPTFMIHDIAVIRML